MQMNMEPEQSLELAVATAQQDIVELQAEFKELHKFVTGNGDPERGLLWIASLHGKLITDLSALLEAQRQATEKRDGEILAAIQDHQINEHYRRGNPWTRLALNIGQNVAVWAIVGFLAFALANVHVTIGGHP